MALRNGVGIASVPYRMTAQVEGQDHGPGRNMPYENPLLAQVATTTWSAAADVSDEIVEAQIIRTTLTDPDGVAYVTDHTVTAAENTAGTDVAGLEVIAGIQAAAINANVELANIVIATSSGAVCTVRWLHPDPRGNWSYTSTVVPAAAETTLVSTEVAASQSTGGVTIPMGRFLAYRTPETGGRRRGGLPSAATDVIACVALRDPTQSRGTSYLSTATNDYPVGCIMTGREQGQVSIKNVGAAAIAGGPVYCVIATTGGDALGQVRGDRDGTADVWTVTPNAVNSVVYGLSIYFPAWDGEGSVTIDVPPITGDGSATATEICDALRTEINAISALTDLLTASGTSTLVLTGDVLGRPFVVLDSQEAGDFTSITHTTTAAAYTKRVINARFDENVAADAVGKLFLNL